MSNNYGTTLSNIGAAADAEVSSLTAQNAQLTSDVARLGKQVSDLTAQLAAATAPPAPKPTGLGIPMPTTPPAGWGQSLYACDFLVDVTEGAFPADGSGGPYANIRHRQRGWTDSSGRGTYDPAVASVSGSVHQMRLQVVNGSARVCTLEPQIPRPFLYGRIDQAMAFDLPSGFKIANLLWGDSLPGETTDAVWRRCGEIDGPEMDGGTEVSFTVHHTGTPDKAQEVRTAPAGFDWRTPHVYSTEWKPGSVSFLVDGKLLGWRTYPPAAVVGSYVGNQPMHLVVQGETSLNGYVPAANAVGTIRTDWVQVWKYTP